MLRPCERCALLRAHYYDRVLSTYASFTDPDPGVAKWRQAMGYLRSSDRERRDWSRLRLLVRRAWASHVPISRRGHGPA